MALRQPKTVLCIALNLSKLLCYQIFVVLIFNCFYLNQMAWLDNIKRQQSFLDLFVKISLRCVMVHKEIRAFIAQKKEYNNFFQISTTFDAEKYLLCLILCLALKIAYLRTACAILWHIFLFR